MDDEQGAALAEQRQTELGDPTLTVTFERGLFRVEWNTVRKYRQTQLTTEEMVSDRWRTIVLDRLGLELDAFGHGMAARRYSC